MKKQKFLPKFKKKLGNDNNISLPTRLQTKEAKIKR